jgi:hypothetical protein
MTSTYDAQYGHTGGGAINISLKSGTNSWHGSGYEYLKRARFNAAAFSDNAHGSPTPASGLDQYGFTIGGPVRVPKVYNGKDKTFFFVAWEKYHEDQEYPAEKIASVPTAAQRTGDFSSTFDNSNRLITIYDPTTGGCRDGLHPDRPNANQGAESTLAFLHALLELRLSENAHATVEARTPQ